MAGLFYWAGFLWPGDDKIQEFRVDTIISPFNLVTYK
jgi:hypothetical protein